MPISLFSLPLSLVPLSFALIPLKFALMILRTKLTDLFADFIHLRTDVSHELRLFGCHLSSLNSPLFNELLERRLPNVRRQCLVEEIIKQNRHGFGLAVLTDPSVN